MKFSLDIIAGRANLGVSTNPEINELIASHAPVAIGVSGGKDSCAVAIAFVEYLRKVGHAGPLVLIHSDLGRVEWADSLPTCRRLALRLGLPLIVVKRAAGDMMDRWLGRWRNNIARYINLECVKVILPWSTPSMRFCTSELKTDIICRDLVRRFAGRRIVSISGVRRDESVARAKAPLSKEQPKLSSRTHNTSGVDYCPIAHWTLADVLAFLDARGFPLHEAYTSHGSSRVSCRFCIMGSADDLAASAAVPDHAPLFREMVGLEIDSTFAFQGGKWLGDVAPHLLTDVSREKLRLARLRAAQREEQESRIPAHLLYTKGWPTCIPTAEEAELLADVRTRVGEILGIHVLYRSGQSVITRYQELMSAKVAKAPRCPL